MEVYKDFRLSDRSLLREFKENDSDMELEWHRDDADRLVHVLDGNGWQFQFDNMLPESIQPGDKIFIPAGEWHRLHSGEGKLSVYIQEAKDQNKDGENDFDDVKIARMLASGMPLEDIKKKYPDLFVEVKLTRGYKKNRSKKSQGRLKALIKRYNDAKKTPGKADDLAAINARDAFEKTQKKSKRKSKHNYAEGSILDESTQRMLVSELIDAMADDLLERKKISGKVHDQLKKKAKDRNAPLGALKAIYRKGMGAFYSSGSRSGQNPHSWAMARVNSVLKGGKARSVDKAQWKQIQKHRKKKRKKGKKKK